MIIDVHTHYGIIEDKHNMTIEIQLETMYKHKIDYALISNIECGVYHEGINGNLKMLELVSEHREKLGGMLWACENMDTSQRTAFEQMYLENQDIVKGIKIHPDISGVRADDACFDFFYNMAGKYELPVLLHTQDNVYSKVEYVENVAKRFPHAQLILGHMGTGTDGSRALEAIREYENLYGDTAWVKLDVVKQAASMGISHKMMFGTDNPIGRTNINHIDRYAIPIHAEYFSCKEAFMDGVMGSNAKKLFKIEG